MSIPVPVEHAAGARIVVGDRVDVITVTDGAARYVASDLLVVSHAEPETTVSQAGPITSPWRSTRMKHWRWPRRSAGESLELVRSTGASPVAGEEG